LFSRTAISRKWALTTTPPTLPTALQAPGAEEVEVDVALEHWRLLVLLVQDWLR
jgi:hypothetical protein